MLIGSGLPVLCPPCAHLARPGGVGPGIVEGVGMLRNVIQSIEALEPKDISENLAERRRALRIRSYCQVTLTIDGSQHKATVTDIGLEGVRLKTLTAALPTGTELS